MALYSSESGDSFSDLVLILAGAPVGFTLILIPVVYILITDAAPPILIPSQMFSAIDSVPLTAIPFFMLTGELMTSATITDRLVELSKRLIGRMRGSMAQVNVLVSMFFAGMNGSVVADTATVGSLLVPAMKRSGYPPAFAAAITAVSSTIGGIIPPSIMMIVLANAGGISVGAVFAAGILPGLLTGALLMVINHVIAVRKKFERSEEPFSLKALAVVSYRSSFALLIPIVLVGSVVGGIAGVAEAGALTATIAMFVGLFIYRTITWSNCKGAFIRAFRNSAMVFIIVAASGPFSWLLTSLGANQQLEAWLLGYANDPMLFALALVIVYTRLPLRLDFIVQQFWSLVIFGLGIVIVYYELQVVATMGGKYWEMWYFAWEDGWFVLKPSYMPKKYAMAILPISGVLTSVAVLMAVLEDCIRYAMGIFRLAGDDEAEIVES